MNYLQAYLDRIWERGNSALAESIAKTVEDIVPQHISNFSFTEHVVGLLVGDVQSGKTSHMFGLMCAAADEGFMNFVLLTTDNIRLQQQTYKRALRDLCDFCICDETEYLKYTQNKLRKPAVIVLKKNAHILRQWKNNFSSTDLCVGNSLFIIDDEGDAASLNARVNQKGQSTVNKHLEEIKKTTSSSIYMEVTGTPQSIFLQSAKSGWQPRFVYYFRSGKGYMRGNFFFPSEEEKPIHIILTDNDESNELLNDDEFPENGLKKALIMHLISSGHIMLSKGEVCNFLIHPGVKTDQHSCFANKIANYLHEISHPHHEAETRATFVRAYTSLKETKKDIMSFEKIYAYITEQLSKDKIRILMLNSVASYAENTQYDTGINIIVGGNSLGRGVTFPQLQTVYYCRVAKSPQADTMWQHARMFGYDRDPDLLRVFMPHKLFKLFSDINRTNSSIIRQIESSDNACDIKIIYPSGLKPTRRNVMDKNTVCIYSGGVNYFPFYPVNNDIILLENLMQEFTDGIYSVNIKMLSKIMEQLDSETSDDWNAKAFRGFINALNATQGKLIVRRNRNIGKRTGTLLSPDDRKMGDAHPDELVLTMYKITGNKGKGWDGRQIWIPNIKLPGDCIYYTGEAI